MALNWENVQKGWKILNAINPEANNSWIKECKRENEFETDMILGIGKKSDDGWENIFMNVKDITPAQLKMWESRKKEVHNSSFIRDEGDGITCIGWF